MSKTVSIIGAGSWGTALAVSLAKKGTRVKLWVYEPEVCDDIKNKKENVRYLPGVQIPDNVIPTNSQEEAIQDTGLTVLAAPAQLVRPVTKQIASYIPKDHIIANVAKGIEVKTLKRLSEVIEEEIPQARVAVLSGPSHAEEVGRDIPTTLVSASKDEKVAETVQRIFMSPTLRVYTNTDIKGVEIGGALKNIIALAAGISDGLGYGDNTKAALMTRGIVEIARLGKAVGASILTFSGLSGIGDLIVTCTSMHSRNRRAGILIGQGKTLDETLHEVGMVVEGVKTCEAAYELAKKLDVSIPITSELYEVLFRGKEPKMAVEDLMSRDRTSEIDELNG